MGCDPNICTHAFVDVICRMLPRWRFLGCIRSNEGRLPRTTSFKFRSRRQWIDDRHWSGGSPLISFHHAADKPACFVWVEGMEIDDRSTGKDRDWKPWDFPLARLDFRTDLGRWFGAEGGIYFLKVVLVRNRFLVTLNGGVCVWCKFTFLWSSKSQE